MHAFASVRRESYRARAVASRSAAVADLRPPAARRQYRRRPEVQRSAAVSRREWLRAAWAPTSWKSTRWTSCAPGQQRGRSPMSTVFTLPSVVNQPDR